MLRHWTALFLQAGGTLAQLVQFPRGAGADGQGVCRLLQPETPPSKTEIADPDQFERSRFEKGATAENEAEK